MATRSCMRAFLLVITPLFLCLFLAGCLKGGANPLTYRPPTSDQCNILRSGAYRELLENPRDSTDEIVQWISTTLGNTSQFGLRVDPVQGVSDDFADLSWIYYDHWSSLSARGGEVLALLDLPLFDNASLAHVLECLGKPEGYSANYWPGFELSGPQVLMKLYYPPLGEVVLASVPVPYLEGIDWSIRSTGVVTIMAEAASADSIFVTRPVSDTDNLLWMYASRGIRSRDDTFALDTYESTLPFIRPWLKEGEATVFDIVSSYP